MRKIGRNDPCPCGSGKKYKRCCLEKDEANRVTPIVSDDHAAHRATGTAEQFDDDKHFDALQVLELIDSALEWENELYRLIARHLYNHTIQEYEADDIAAVVTLWNAYSSEVMPVTRKIGVYPAALEYCILLIGGYEQGTQASLAKKYGVAAGTISKRAEEIMQFAERSFPEMFEDAGGFDDEPEMPMPGPSHRMAAERGLQDIGKLLEGRDFASMEEATAFLNDAIQQPAWNHSRPTSDKDRAQDLLFDAWDEPSRTKRVQMAKQALKLYPDSPDAYNILAQDQARDLEETARLLKQGMEAGERDLGPDFFQENKGHFWGIISTRPYMRAKSGYAEVRMAQGKTEEAIRHFKESLELDPGDHQGLRYRLTLAYLEIGQLANAAKLMKKYGEDESANFCFNKILVEYGTHGQTPKLTPLYKKAKKQNPHVTDYLLGKKRLPKQEPAYIGFGDANEAIEYAIHHHHLWRRQPDLLRWLAEQSK